MGFFDMHLRFLRILVVVCSRPLSRARALDFDDEDPAPVQGEVGRALEYPIGTHAGCLPHHVVIQSGSLPAGTTLAQVDDHTALVSGIPTESGSFSAWLAVKDCDNRSAEALFEFDIGTRTYAIQTSSLPNATLGSSYSAKLQAGGHPIRSEKWELVQGTLPAGLTLAADGSITGTPTAAGASTFTVKATSVGDDGATRVDTRQLTLTVTGSYTITASRRLGEVGVPFRATLAASGGAAPLTWSSAGGLPQGLTLDSHGAISGAPKRTAPPRTRRSRSSSGRGWRSRHAASGPLTPGTSTRRRSPPGAASRPSAGRSPAARCRAACGSRAERGTISGSPSHGGTFRFTLRVRDALGAVSTKRVTLRVR